MRPTDSSTARMAGQPPAGRWWRGRAAAAVALAGTALLGGCGQVIAGAQPTATATAGAASAGSSCAQAMPLVHSAAGVLQQLRGGALTGTAAQPVLAADQAGIRRLALTTSQTVLQENLAELSDAFAAFRAVMLDRNAPAYPDTLANLTGLLAGFRQTCPVTNPDFTAGTQGWVADSGNTALSRSATAHQGPWSLRVANTGKSPATAGFTDSPPWISTTLKGSEQIGLWARAVTGTPTLTLQVQELAGGSVVGSQQVTMRLGPAFQFEGLTYQIRRPGTSRLSVTVSAAGLAPGEAFLVDGITIVRD
ncbi:MAG: hypothetical protein ACHP9Z_04105 [Streptosporangiales bacterium]